MCHSRKKVNKRWENRCIREIYEIKFGFDYSLGFTVKMRCKKQ